jgi:hypothetical protein
MLAACRCGVHGAYIGLGLGACPCQRYGATLLAKTVPSHHSPAPAGSATSRSQHDQTGPTQRQTRPSASSSSSDWKPWPGLYLWSTRIDSGLAPRRCCPPSTVAVSLTFSQTFVDSAFGVLGTILLTSVTPRQHLLKDSDSACRKSIRTVADVSCFPACLTRSE